MNILTVATFAFPDHYGGAERVLADANARLAARGHRVTLLTGNVADGPPRERLGDIDVHRYPVDRSSPAQFWRSVWKGVRGALQAGVGADADVLSLHQIISAAAAVAPRGAGCRARVLTFHAPYHLEFLARFRAGNEQGSAPLAARAVASVMARADRYVVRRSQEVLVLSDYMRGHLSRLDKAAGERAVFAPGGVDLERFAPPRDADDQGRAARVAGVPNDGLPLLLTVRRLVQRMGVADLIEALAAMSTPARLAIAGDGDLRADLEQQAAALGVSERVVFLGRVPDDTLTDLYRAADAFVLPTRSLEGFGMVTAEALASGLPVVATDAGANAEVLAGVDAARIVPASDPKALATALDTLLADPAALASAQRSARAHAEKHLGWEHHIDAFEQAAERSQRAAR